MKKYALHIACSLILLFPALMGAAQTAHDPSAQTGHGPARATSPVYVRAGADQQRILVGEPIRLLLEATVTGNAPLTWPVMDSLPHFAFLEKGRIDTVIRPDGRYYRQSLTVTSFDSGTWAIPRLPFISGVKKVFSDSVRIEVDFSKFDPNKDYHDIRDIIDIPNPYAKWIVWFVAGATLLALALVLWMISRKKLIPGPAPPPEAAAPPLAPYEEALAALDELARTAAWESLPAKAYYTRLNDVLRLFVLRRLSIASMAETNEELIGQLRRLPFPPEEFSRLAQTLRMSDFVKFAKYQPGVADKEDGFRSVRSSVEELNRLGIAMQQQQEAEEHINENNITQ